MWPSALLFSTAQPYRRTCRALPSARSKGATTLRNTALSCLRGYLETQSISIAGQSDHDLAGVPFAAGIVAPFACLAIASFNSLTMSACFWPSARLSGV